MIYITVKCPRCESENIRKFGFDKIGNQRYECRNTNCKKNTFILDYCNKACSEDINDKIIKMTLNGSGIRDISRVLGISTYKVMNELKKKENLLNKVNISLINSFDNINDLKIDIVKIDEAEIDEMWSFVYSKKQQRWLWHAIDHDTGAVLAYTFGSREDVVFRELKELLRPFGIDKFYTDGNWAYERNIDSEKHVIGKKNTQKIERKHLTFRTRIKRLARKTICFSKTVKLHDIVIGLFINVYEFGLNSCG